MKCRSIYAFAVRDSRNIDRIAVIVFESLDDKAGNMVRFRDAIQGGVGRELASTLESLQALEPSPDLAKQGGF